MGQQAAETATVRKSVTVRRRPDDAFRLFTDGIGTWWPLETHSPSEGRGETVVMEPRVGGRLYERTRDGEEPVWGEVLVWEPPSRLVFSWHLGGPVTTEVELRFTADGDATRVDLEHRGWERHGDRAAELHASYDSGWDYVFGERYASAADGP
jgi:uncharacterized protein YndB with AHSA1/START domain